jgi:hypothetical protein
MRPIGDSMVRGTLTFDPDVGHNNITVSLNLVGTALLGAKIWFSKFTSM